MIDNAKSFSLTGEEFKVLPLGLLEPNEGQIEGVPRNPRTITDARFESLRENIRRYPQFLKKNLIKVYPLPDDSGKYVVVGGNMRLLALRELGYENAPCAVIPRTASAEELKAYTILDNSEFGRWDYDALANEWDEAKLREWGLDSFDYFGEDTDPSEAEASADGDDDKEQGGEDEAARKLADTFIMQPFSILDSRSQFWQERKAAWRSVIAGTGESREDAIGYGMEVRMPKQYKEYNKVRAKLGISFREYLEKYVPAEVLEKAKASTMYANVSLFDPVLAEIMAHWFTPYRCAKIFDPFAGDTQKGLVFGLCGYEFKGIELRSEQVEINRRDVERFRVPVSYVCDDGQNVAAHFEPESQDLLFSCPPYFDLEVYSQLPNDASNAPTYAEFIGILGNAYKSALGCLKPNRFAVVVVGDVRSKKDTSYYGFPDDIKRIFREAGALLYNEGILSEIIGSKAITASNTMKYRKLPKTHQNVLIFYKGDTSEIKNVFPPLSKRKGDILTLEQIRAFATSGAV